MSAWAEFEHAEPELAGHGRRLLYHTGTGMGFLATVRKDGGPRVHPICPILADGGLYAFIVNLGWKYRDLLRDGRFALHSFPTQAGGEEFYVTGGAEPRPDPGLRGRVIAATGGTLGTHEMEVLFEFLPERALYTKWEGWGTVSSWPTFTKWAA